MDACCVEGGTPFPSRLSRTDISMLNLNASAPVLDPGEAISHSPGFERLSYQAAAPVYQLLIPHWENTPVTFSIAPQKHFNFIDSCSFYHQFLFMVLTFTCLQGEFSVSHRTGIYLVVAWRGRKL